MDKDDLWIVEPCSALVTTYVGTYVAGVHETLVAVGDAGKEVEDKARAMAPEKMPSVLRVPRDEDRACLVENSLPTHTRRGPVLSKPGRRRAFIAQTGLAQAAGRAFWR